MTKKKNKQLNNIKNSNSYDNNSNHESVKSNKTSGLSKTKQRQENSLGELTKNFIKYIREKGDNVVHINDVVKKLKVKKRRIYDITNVLEGIGYIKKLEKNTLVWMKEDIHDDISNLGGNAIQKEIEEKKIQLENLKKQESDIDITIQDLNAEFESLIKEEDFKKYGYITKNDLRHLIDENNTNLIAIQAPVGTCIEIPEPKSIEDIYKKTLFVRYL